MAARSGEGSFAEALPGARFDLLAFRWQVAHALRNEFHNDETDTVNLIHRIQATGSAHVARMTAREARFAPAEVRARTSAAQMPLRITLSADP